jgi:hypothetical protein
MQMPALMTRATWCLAMEMLLRLASLQGNRPQAGSRCQGLSEPKRQALSRATRLPGPNPGNRVAGSVSMPTEAKGVRLV